MIPTDKVKKIIERYNSLEKDLSTGKFDSKLFGFLVRLRTRISQPLQVQANIAMRCMHGFEKGLP